MHALFGDAEAVAEVVLQLLPLTWGFGKGSRICDGLGFVGDGGLMGLGVQG